MSRLGLHFKGLKFLEGDVSPSPHISHMLRRQANRSPETRPGKNEKGEDEETNPALVHTLVFTGIGGEWGFNRLIKDVQSPLNTP